MFNTFNFMRSTNSYSEAPPPWYFLINIAFSRELLKCECGVRHTDGFTKL